MAAEAVTNPSGKKIGTTTVGATAGTGVAGAAAVILVWVLGECGVDVPGEVSAAIAVLIGAVGTLVGGKLVPSNQVRTQRELIPVVEGSQDEKAAAAAAVVPEGGGSHRADVVADVVSDEDYLPVDDTVIPNDQ